MLSKAKWIRGNCENPVFSRRIELDGEVLSALAKVTAMGLYECYIDGARVGSYVMTPGWTNYNDHIQYQEYDITDMIKNGSVFDVKCGCGWAVSKMGLDEETSAYADHVSCIFCIDITYQNGEKALIISDENTEVYTSDIVKTDIYGGETVNRTVERKLVGKAAEDNVNTKLVAQIGEYVREQERVRPVKLIVTPKGEHVIDFGQNMTGYVKVSVHGRRGDVIRIRHGEVLDKDGNFYDDNMRGAKAEAVYIMGCEYEEFRPSFTFYGFRYICVDEFPGEITADCFEAVEVHSDIRRTGSFVCGHEGINKLYSNIVWGQKDNFLDVPTDCPQRDERLGWTGDAQMFVRTAAINFDVERFFTKWLYDMRTEQLQSGAVPAVIPNCIRRIPQPVSAAWADSSVICPLEIYLAYGDKKILEDNFELMRNWIEYMHNYGSEEYLWLGAEHFGDWLGLDAHEGSYKGSTDEDLIASCFFAYSVSLFVNAGKTLGRDMSEYERMYENIRAKINERFTKDGAPICRTQTACVLLLHFDLCDCREIVEKTLLSLLEENNGRLATGFVGTPYLLHALSETGNSAKAYDLLLFDGYPSWLYTVKKGATTMWEHWDCIKEDGSFWSSDMNSFNHYAYGSVFDWIFGVAVGVKVPADGAGYAKINIAPTPDCRLGFTDASIETRHGRLRAAWRYMQDFIRYEYDIPKGTNAELCLPDGKKYTLTEGRYIFYTGI